MIWHDDRGRVYTDVPDDLDEDGFAELVAARNRADAANLAVLRRSGRLWNQWDADEGDRQAWR